VDRLTEDIHHLEEALEAEELLPEEDGRLLVGMVAEEVLRDHQGAEVHHVGVQYLDLLLQGEDPVAELLLAKKLPDPLLDLAPAQAAVLVQDPEANLKSCKKN